MSGADLSPVSTDEPSGPGRSGRAARLAGAAAARSVVMAAGSFGAGATLWIDPNEAPFAEHFADVTVGYGVGLVVWLVGAVVLALAWWRLGRLIHVRVLAVHAGTVRAAGDPAVRCR